MNKFKAYTKAGFRPRLDHQKKVNPIFIFKIKKKICRFEISISILN